jgi:1,4-alpha-glucan branching enzyme
LDWFLLEDTPFHRYLQNWVRDINQLLQREPALYELDFDGNGFEWIEPNDAEQSVFSYVRYSADQQEMLVFVGNFTPVPRYNYRVGVPRAGYYRELLNSDSQHYGGGNIGNTGGFNTNPVAWHHWDQSLNVTVPPLACVILKWAPEQAESDETVKDEAEEASVT